MREGEALLLRELWWCVRVCGGKLRTDVGWHEDGLYGVISYLWLLIYTLQGWRFMQVHKWGPICGSFSDFIQPSKLVYAVGNDHFSLFWSSTTHIVWKFFFTTVVTISCWILYYVLGCPCWIFHIWILESYSVTCQKILCRLYCSNVGLCCHVRDDVNFQVSLTQILIGIRVIKQNLE